MYLATIRSAGLWLIAALAPTICACAARAEPSCAPREAWAQVIEGEKYGEQRIGRGLLALGDGHSVLELFSSPDGETFTVLVTGPRPHPDGAYLESCLIASGRYWQRIPFALPGSSM